MESGEWKEERRKIGRPEGGQAVSIFASNRLDSCILYEINLF